jgi:hypothetical protein
VERLKIDNQSKEMEISRLKGERKMFNNTVSSIEVLKRDLKTKLA